MALYSIDDCCVEVVFEATPLLIVDADETDPFTGEEIIWPCPRVYWSNGMVTDGRYGKVNY